MHSEQRPLWNMEEQRPLWKLEAELNSNWTNLKSAGTATLKSQADLLQSLESDFNETNRRFSSEDTSLVVFGSLARKEWIDWKSDLDWTFLVDGQAQSFHLNIAQEIRENLKKQARDEAGVTAYRFGEPGPSGTFGNLTFSHHLIHLIGGQEDTNKNTTQRILLLLESEPIGPRAAYDRVVIAVIDRYLREEPNILSSDGRRYKVPRFLLNDIVRFWRTMAVDFASKQRDRGGEGWGLRNAKLRMSRKLIFAAGLLMCFSCSLDTALQEKISTEKDDINLKHLSNHVRNYARQVPLDILAQAIIKFEPRTGLGEKIFSAYDQFLGMMADDETRKHLKKLKAKNSCTDKRFNEIRRISEQFNAGLTALFFDNPTIAALTRKYGVF